MRKRTIGISASSALIALILAGCAPGGGMPGMDMGDGSEPPMATVEEAAPNAADQMFVMMMIPHHQQAIEMSDMLLAKDGIDQRVVDLAQQIKDAQGPEIELMQSWLEEWGVPMDDSMAGMEGMEGMGMGTMSEADMASLESATGVEASKLFLEQMIVHHEGAISMAEDVLAAGEQPDVLQLAQEIIDGQSLEIETIREILATL